MSITERWAPIPGYIGYYEASDQGRIRAVERQLVQKRRDGNTYTRTLQEHIIVLQRSSKGYWRAQLSRDGITRKHLVHHLVLAAHVGERPAGLLACHADDDRDNNTPANLRWSTPEQNIADRFRNGGYKFPNRRRPRRVEVAA